MIHKTKQISPVVATVDHMSGDGHVTSGFSEASGNSSEPFVLTTRGKWLDHPLIEGDQSAGALLYWMFSKHQDWHIRINMENLRSLFGQRTADRTVRLLIAEGWIELVQEAFDGSSRLYCLTTIAAQEQWGGPVRRVTDGWQLKRFRRAKKNHTKKLRRDPVIDWLLRSEEKLLGKSIEASLKSRISGRLYTLFTRFAKGIKEKLMRWSDTKERADHWDLKNAHPSFLVTSKYVPRWDKTEVDRWFNQLKAEKVSKKDINRLLKTKCWGEWDDYEITKRCQAECPAAYFALVRLRNEWDSPTRFFEQREAEAVNELAERLMDEGIDCVRKHDQLTTRRSDRTEVLKQIDEFNLQHQYIKFVHKYDDKTKNLSQTLSSNKGRMGWLPFSSGLNVVKFSRGVEENPIDRGGGNPRPPPKPPDGDTNSITENRRAEQSHQNEGWRGRLASVLSDVRSTPDPVEEDWLVV